MGLYKNIFTIKIIAYTICLLKHIVGSYILKGGDRSSIAADIFKQSTHNYLSSLKFVAFYGLILFKRAP